MSTKQLQDIELSILDLAPVLEGSTPAESFKNSLTLAQRAEELDYHRFWLAEHHSMPGIASSATSLVIGYIANGTSKIRVGSGGIMLPNHAPLVIAEQFGTLESMYPGRIDLGLGRAPGTDQMTAHALRRNHHSDGSEFPELVAELRSYLNPTSRNLVRAIPGEGLDIPIWLLGSSGFSARLAAKLGLPFSFASHFAPDYLLPALQLYRDQFQPSDVLDEPYAMIGVNVITADTDEKAAWLATSQEQQFLNVIRGEPGMLRPPVEDIHQHCHPNEKAMVDKMLHYSVAGSQRTVTNKLQQFLDETQADEIIINSNIYDQHERIRSYELLAEAVKA
ncbi:LLM class flavin-dependent oxidoreductase [Desertibacillus haloalkaliphilus]|uniref:LLM class flavin-dependent oxidoreductase n=1 Tax=Desertibacillus haloalkaliphilus TaxID=1328930 RepID=UPI001C275441|nr:LLM class flavin-dependent oxidoreductase [Desertibacillus haloalkaliphilus]MBU8905316.1 LLM class flavin-dependent oxidoreductase [Desertibacillus haloalkaliphilus]